MPINSGRSTMPLHRRTRSPRTDGSFWEHDERGRAKLQIIANVPVLPSRDLDRSATFYRRLGYRAVRQFPDYLILASGSAELHLALMRIDAEHNPAGAYLRVNGIEAFAQALGVKAEDKPWGQREFAISDPDENLLRIGEASPD